MPSLWKFGGLTPLDLIKLVVRKMGEDELGTRSASLSYYFLLALFPLFLFLASLAALFAGPGSHLQENIVSALARVAPGSASELVRGVVRQTFQSGGGVKLAVGILGALWAASGGMSAVVVSLNKIYGLAENRSWLKQKLTIVGLTVALSGLMLAALVLALYGGELGQMVFAKIGEGNLFQVAWKVIDWPVSFAAMFLSFSIVYYFAPDIEERKWYWVTPGSLSGVVLWLLASIGFKIYLHFFNSYSATYGSLGAVVILMLWLYITGFAILIGAEVNWVIESQDKKTASFEQKKQAIERRIKAA